MTGNYGSMSQDGSKVVASVGRRQHSAPWGRAYSREIWCNLEFPDGFWFEDTIQAYCIDSAYAERYIGVRYIAIERIRRGSRPIAQRRRRGWIPFG